MLKQMLVNSSVGQAALHLRDTVELHRAVHGQREALGCLANDILARHLLDRLCADGAIFVDVGCHIGSVLAGVARYSRPGRMIAVEAIPEKVVSLRRRFPDVEIHGCAVGDHEGEVEFTIDLERSGFSSLDPALKDRIRSGRVIAVRLTTLDAILPHEGIDLIKIDVEGAELGVLRGAQALVAASRPVFMFESGPQEMEGFPNGALWQWFEDHDYDVVLPNRLAHFGPGMSRDIFLDSHRYPRHTTNYFGIPRERRDATRLRARALLGFD